MIITAIKAQVKNAERVSVFVEGKYSFSLNYAQLLEQKLRTGLELEKERLAELKKMSELGKLYERLLNFVMIRPRSRREVEEYCRRKKIEPADYQPLIERLEKRGYINDITFAKAWVESRRLTKTMSTRRLRLELQQKGVATDIIAETLIKSAHNETDALQVIIAKKRRLTKYQDDQKLMQYLARNGFGFDDIKNALHEDSYNDKT